MRIRSWTGCFNSLFLWSIVCHKPHCFIRRVLIGICIIDCRKSVCRFDLCCDNGTYICIFSFNLKLDLFKIKQTFIHKFILFSTENSWISQYPWQIFSRFPCLIVNGCLNSYIKISTNVLETGNLGLWLFRPALGRLTFATLRQFYDVWELPTRSAVLLFTSEQNSEGSSPAFCFLYVLHFSRNIKSVFKKYIS